MPLPSPIARLAGKVRRATEDRRDRRDRRGDPRRAAHEPADGAGRGDADRERGGRSVADGDAETVIGGVVVSYEPEHDGDADPGEVVWAWVPYEDDPGQGKDRPVLVIGWDGPKLAVVPLSSRDRTDRRDGDEWVPVGTGAWDRERRPSFADAGRLLRVSPAGVRREGAALDERRFAEVVARVRALHDW